MKSGVDRDANTVWKALADSTRRMILEHLHDAPMTTGELCKRFPSLSRYGVMKHLSVLEEAQLVEIRREGRFRWNMYRSIPIDSIIAPWVTKHVAGLKDRFGRLRTHVETPEDDGT